MACFFHSFLNSVFLKIVSHFAKTFYSILLHTHQNMIRLLIIFFLFTLSLVAIAQTTPTQNSSVEMSTVTLSGIIKDKTSKSVLPFVNVVLKKEGNFVTGTVTTEEGLFTMPGISPGNYTLELSYMGYKSISQALLVGKLSAFIDLGTIEIEENVATLNEVVVTGQQDAVVETMDKKTYSIADNISQSGGSILQAMQNLPGITMSQEGGVQLRGSDRVIVLIDGKQTALTGFGSQAGLDNIPASAIERIEIINNPSAKYDANGMAGIINIIMKKETKEGINGKVGFTTGLGALWVRKENLPDIRPQYTQTPKINPSLSLNYRKNKLNVFLQADNLYTQTLNKNEFVTRTYEDGTIIRQQLKRNRNTNFFTSKVGLDYFPDERNTFTISGLFSQETIIDRGDQPFFNEDLSERRRLWQFLEDEVLTATMISTAYGHKFKQPGHVLNIGFNYTFDREDEKYFFDNIMPAYTGKDAFALIADQHVADLTIDYIKPLKYGRLETGFKFRKRDIPTNMVFSPGLNSPLDTSADGRATYKEQIPALYGNYVFENRLFEAEIGLRIEHVGLKYEVEPGHSTYTSDGYNYTQPFPTVRLAYKLNEANKLSFFYNRRVDRPNEVDIRIFPKYDDAEIIKVGNPALRPQFTNSLELGYKTSWTGGDLYGAAYHRFANGTITRISSIVPGSTLIYAIFQNAGKSYNTGLELVWNQELARWYAFNLAVNGYRNQINAFRVENQYPVPNTFSAGTQEILSGNIKLNNIFHLPGNVDAQLTAVYLAPDIISQGKIAQRFSLDLGVKKTMQQGKGELFFNATDLLNTMILKREIQGEGFNYVSADYYETQVIRAGYSYKF